MTDSDAGPSRRLERPPPTSQARALRQRSTDAEQRLWRSLRRGQLGTRFRRQHPLAGYIVDFCCLRANLIIEVDGAQHGESDGLVGDAQRDAKLRELGFRVARFTNHQVLLETETVVEQIHALLTGP